MDETVLHEKPVRDDLYYLENVIFLVEDNLFKVPKQYFQKNSRIFSNIFGDDHTAEGSSDEKPIHLYSIQKVDFERLLAVMYPIGRCGLGPATLGRSEWESTLKLSTLWELGDLRTLAIQNLSKIEMREVDQITLGKEYRVADWLVKGYTKLAERDNTISEDEGDILGPKSVILLFQVREAGIKRKTAKSRGYTRVQSYNYENAIRPVFAQQLADAEQVSESVDPTICPSIQPDGCPSVSLILQPIRNIMFYMESVIFLVEDILFRVPQAYFEHTAIFKTIFTLLPADNSPVDGSDDEHPFRLEGISKCDFRAFLHVVYQHDLPPKKMIMSEEEWIAALKLSTMWDFFNVRKLAIEALSRIEMNPITKILVGKQYMVRTLLFDGYYELAVGTGPISVAEAERLGWETAIHIFNIRQKSSTSCCHIEDEISQLFAKELEDSSRLSDVDEFGGEKKDALTDALGPAT